MKSVPERVDDYWKWLVEHQIELDSKDPLEAWEQARWRLKYYTEKLGDEIAPPAPVLPDTYLRNCRVYPTRQHLMKSLPSPDRVLEIGTKHGDNANWILQETQPQEVHIIDPKMFRFRHNDARFFLHEGLSTDVLPTLRDYYFDWIYVDGDHSYEVVTEDLNWSKRKLKPNGIIICNDYTSWDCRAVWEYGVQRAVNEFCMYHDWEIIGMGLEPFGRHDVALRKL